MIELNDDNDPMLFAIGLPNGRLIIQFMEVVATLQAVVPQGAEPSPHHIVDAIRKSSRTPEVAATASDAMLAAAYHRIAMAVEREGKG